VIGEADIRELGTGRWTVPLLALLLAEDGARFAALVGTLGIARDSLSRTLAHAIERGWVSRHEGYGHPLRPEYVLTPHGRAIAAACARMMAVRHRLGLEPHSLPRWSLPILGRLRREPVRFSDLLGNLAPITPRALSLNLKQMVDGRLITRSVAPVCPPSALYGLAEPGHELMRCLGTAP